MLVAMPARWCPTTLMAVDRDPEGVALLGVAEGGGGHLEQVRDDRVPAHRTAKFL
jgi:hypothetical protein